MHKQVSAEALGVGVYKHIICGALIMTRMGKDRQGCVGGPGGALISRVLGVMDLGWVTKEGLLNGAYYWPWRRRRGGGVGRGFEMGVRRARRGVLAGDSTNRPTNGWYWYRLWFSLRRTGPEEEGQTEKGKMSKCQTEEVLRVVRAWGERASSASRVRRVQLVIRLDRTTEALRGLFGPSFNFIRGEGLAEAQREREKEKHCGPELNGIFLVSVSPTRWNAGNSLTEGVVESNQLR
ncbi:hypothetical protein FB451DRAFT_1185580 [Mycena latifolia]|nr:hypothetical protein FB451DRAFT_1185580 [Mycena latifolia]